jgi:cytochrome c oxidase subunit 2
MTPRARRLALTTAAASVLLAAGACGSGSPSALDPKGPAAERIAGVWWLMLGLAVVVYVVVTALILVASLRRRREEGRGLDENRFIWWGGVILPTIVLVGLGVVTVTATADLRQAVDGALRIEVEGYKWWWEARYPDTGFVTANEIHIPVGQPVELELTSADVIHSFWVPQLAGKVDLVPGQSNILRVQADEPGEYRGQCAEYCGLQHGRMAFLVIADPPEEFERWRESHRRAPEPAGDLAVEGEEVFLSSSCAGCHAVRGTSAQGQLGPDLSDFGSRRTIGALTVENNRENLTQWMVDAQAVKPGNLMPPVSLDPVELEALIAYMESLR